MTAINKIIRIAVNRKETHTVLSECITQYNTNIGNNQLRYSEVVTLSDLPLSQGFIWFLGSKQDKKNIDQTFIPPTTTAMAVSGKPFFSCASNATLRCICHFARPPSRQQQQMQQQFSTKYRVATKGLKGTTMH